VFISLPACIPQNQNEPLILQNKPASLLCKARTNSSGLQSASIAEKASVKPIKICVKIVGTSFLPALAEITVDAAAEMQADMAYLTASVLIAKEKKYISTK